MPIWKPPGSVSESTAKWEANPDRTTYFLQVIVDMIGEGRFKETPTVSDYREISKLFWHRYNIYHTAKQFRNHYQNRKALWQTVCWARDRSGIGWDDSRKMILASDDWWKCHEGRKGLLSLKDKAIPDYDLLHTVFTGDAGDTDYCYGPEQPIPLDSPEGSGDSENAEGDTFFDPQSQRSGGATSMSTSSGNKRPAANCPAPTEKRRGKKKASYSPTSAKLAKQYEVFFQVKNRQKRIDESMGAATGSQIPSGTTINSKTTMDMCMRVLTEVLKLKESSDSYMDAIDMFAANPDLQLAFLNFKEPTNQLKWLERRIGPCSAQLDEAPTQPGLYDLNQPAREDV